jgi:hypothetical protein
LALEDMFDVRIVLPFFGGAEDPETESKDPCSTVR